MTIRHIYDILLSREKSWSERGAPFRALSRRNPIDKGKPFERMGHKALEPNSPEGLMVVSCQKGDIKALEFKPILQWKNRFFYCFDCALKGHRCFSEERRGK